MKTKSLSYGALLISLLAICLLIYDAGFYQAPRWQSTVDSLYAWLLLALLVAVPVRYLVDFPKKQHRKVWALEGMLWMVYLWLFLNGSLNPSAGHLLPKSFKIGLVFAFGIGFLRELLAHDLRLRYKRTHPALLFVISFATLIVVGTLLLMLPQATHTGIRFTDALFTSTSAVCVTGLIVVDTGSYFTLFGQSILLVLIQLGGIGIMTFTSFFAFFFKGGVSYKNLIMLGNLTNEEKMSEVMSTLVKILLFTFVIEAIGVGLIYLNMLNQPGVAESGSFFFALFHSVSAFCNSGFSTLSNSLYDVQYRYNYNLHLLMASLFVIGGLGFPVIINLFSYLKYYARKQWHKWNKVKEPLVQAHIITLNTKLVLYTTAILIVAGTVGFFLLEQHKTLAEHQGAGKVATALFGALTPRTAGFNTVATGQLTHATLLLLLLFMWIGASPASTGGGIKTSTFALGVLNIISMARGRSRVEVGRREIPDFSLKRAFAFMALGIMVMGAAMVALLLTEPAKAFEDIVFEAFSAFGTVGLSRGITGDLSDAGRYVLIFTMFAGRVGALTLLIALFRKPDSAQYRYPAEQVLIN